MLLKKRGSLLCTLDYSIICFKNLGLFNFSRLKEWLSPASIVTCYSQSTAYIRGICLKTKIFLDQMISRLRKVSHPMWFKMIVNILAGNYIIYWEILASVTHSELHILIYINNGIYRLWRSLHCIGGCSFSKAKFQSFAKAPENREKIASSFCMFH